MTSCFAIQSSGPKVSKFNCFNLIDTNKSPNSLLAEKLAEKFAEHGFRSPIRALWQCHFAHGHDEVCERLWNNHLSTQTFQRIDYILKVAVKQQNEKLVVKLLDLLKTTQIRRDVLGLVYSALITIHSSKNEPELAMNVIHEALKEVSIKNLQTEPLHNVKRVLESFGESFPYVIPKRDSTHDTESINQI